MVVILYFSSLLGLALPVMYVTRLLCYSDIMWLWVHYDDVYPT